MSATTHVFPSFRYLVVACLALPPVSSSRADSWLPPHDFNTTSETGKFVAHVMPRKNESKALLIVSECTASKTNEVWRAELSNDVSPCQLWVSNDGESVVTSDNWGGIGYGDDVIAVYNRHGQIAKYSLEEIVPPPKPKPDAPAWLSARQGYDGKFSHSTSSRHWRENSIEFFHKEADELHFCIWLDWENRWVVWRMSDGRRINITSEQAKQLNREGRTRALNQAKAGGFIAAALNFLGRLRFKEDRPLIEAWLQDTNFSCGSLQSSSSDKPAMEFAFTALSYKRETADKILSRWDGEVLENGGLANRKEYQFLGTLKFVVVFPMPPAKSEGSIRVYLVPESIVLNSWASQRPAHYLIATLSNQYPNVFENGQLKEGKLSRDVDFIIYGITPGRYRVKVVWNKVAPFTKEDHVICLPHQGDYESTTGPLFTIRKGVVTEGVRVECNKLIEK